MVTRSYDFIGGVDSGSTSLMNDITSVQIAITSVVATNYSPSSSDFVIEVISGSSSPKITLPNAVGLSGKQYRVVKMDTSSSTVKVFTTSSQVLSLGSTGFNLSAQFDFLHVYSDNSNYKYWDSRFNAATVLVSSTPLPIVTKYSGPINGTHSITNSCTYFILEAVAGGGAGSGGGTSGGSGGQSGSTTLFGSIVTCLGGGTGSWPTDAGIGGTASISGSGLIALTITGGDGGAGSENVALFRAIGGLGGASAFGGGGGANLGKAGNAGKFGGGGAGGGCAAVTNGVGGQGGGAGGYVKLLVKSPAASYSFFVGAGGNVGSDGAGGTGGGKGGDGVLIITEYFGS